MKSETKSYTLPSIGECDFCLIPETKTTEVFEDLHGDLPHTLDVPGLPRSYTVLQDVVPVAEEGGHLLLMPNEHRISLATVDDQVELAMATDQLITPLREMFPANPIFTFEHGPGFIEDQPIACGGCHMDHAHGHLLLLPEGQELTPIQTNVERTLYRRGWSDIESQRIQSDQIFSNVADTAGMQPYLQVGMVDSSNKRRSITYIQKQESEYVPSQLLRQVVAEVVYQRPEPSFWHWRDISEMGMASQKRMSQIRKDVVDFRAKTGF